MKRMTKMPIYCLLILISVMLSSQVDASPTNEQPYKKVYTTSEQILFDMIRPSISQYVNEHYKTNVLWFEPNIVDARLEMRRDISSYVVAMFIKVDDPTDNTLEFALDKLTIRIDSNQYRSSDYKDKPEIRLVEYRRVVPSKLESTSSKASDNSNLIRLNQFVSFNLYVPTYYEQAVQYEIKEPTDVNRGKAEFVIVNYFDNQGTYLFGLRENRNNSYLSHIVTKYDVQHHTKSERVVRKTFSFKPSGEEAVSMNGKKVWYEPMRGQNGGTLKMVLGDTYVELVSTPLSKEEIIKVAASLKKIT